MLRHKITKWALYAVIDYIREHGDEMLQQMIEWLAAVADQQDNAVFASVSPPDGCESFCEAQLNLYRDILAEDGKDA